MVRPLREQEQAYADGEIPLGRPSKAEKLRRKAELLAIKLKAVKMN
jgi:hypothetical protein